MKYKAPGGDSGTNCMKSKYIAREEFENAMRALQKEINATHPERLLELPLRPPST